jgi:hypothetical protein
LAGADGAAWPEPTGPLGRSRRGRGRDAEPCPEGAPARLRAGTVVLLSTTGLCRHVNPALWAGPGPGRWSIGPVGTGSMFHRPGSLAGLARCRRDGWDRWCWRAPATGHAATPRQRPGWGLGATCGSAAGCGERAECRYHHVADEACVAAGQHTDISDRPGHLCYPGATCLFAGRARGACIFVACRPHPPPVTGA